MVKFSEEELKQQIRDAVQPTSDVAKDVDQLLISVMLKDSSNISKADEQLGDNVGQVAWWKGPLHEQSIGVLTDVSTIQLYKKTRYGFVPKDLPVDAKDWNCVQNVVSYHYIEKGGIILLVLDTDL